MMIKDIPQSADAGLWPIFVVSLADAVKRRENLYGQLQSIGMTAEIVDAVDGRQGLSPDIERLVDRELAEVRVGRKMTGGEFACALSHQKIYQRIVDEGLPGAIVLEDDAILTPLFAEFITRKGYLAADLVQMDHMHTRVWRGGHRMFFPGVMLIPLAMNASLTTGYSISANAARYILARSQPLAGLADWPCDVMPLSPVVTMPRVVDHPEVETSDSTLEEERNASMEEASLRAVKPPRQRASRFLHASYWKRWWIKRRSKKIA